MDKTTLSNEVLDAIEGRRSVRGFLDRPVPQATIEHLLRHCHVKWLRSK